MLHNERSAQLSATLYDITIIEITCRSISPESLAQEIDAFFFDLMMINPAPTR